MQTNPLHSTKLYFFYFLFHNIVVFRELKSKTHWLKSEPLEDVLLNCIMNENTRRTCWGLAQQILG